MRSRCASVTAVGGASIQLFSALQCQTVPNGRETPIFKQDSLKTSSSNLVVLVGRRAKQASHFLETILRLLENRQVCEMGWATSAARIAESGPEPSCFTLAPYFSLPGRKPDVEVKHLTQGPQLKSLCLRDLHPHPVSPS